MIDPQSSKPSPQQTAMTPPVHSPIQPHQTQPSDWHLRRAQVELLYESLPTGLLATLACAVILVTVEWEVMPHGQLLAWLAAMSAISAGRWGVMIAFQRSAQAAESIAPWEQAFLAGTALAGIGWGATAWVLFHDESLPHQLFLAFVLGGISAGAAATLASRFTAFLCFTVPTLLPIIARLLIQDEPLAKSMALYIAIFTGLMAVVAFRMSRTVVRSLQLQFENKGLLVQLENQIEQDRQMDLMLDIDREHYRFAIEQASDIICRADLDGRITFINPAVTRLLGYAETEILGHRFTEFIREDYRAKAKRAYVRQFARRRSASYSELPITTKMGQHIWVGQNVQLLVRDEAVVGFQAVVRDISAIKQAEQELRRSQQFIASVVEHLPSMVFVKDAKDFRYVQLNRAGEELLGYQRSEFIGKSDCDFFPRDQAEFSVQKDREVLASGHLLDIPEEPIHTRHRGLRILHTRKIPLYDESGKPQYLLGISEDITEHKRAEEANAELRYVIQHGVEGLAILDQHGTYVHMNPAHAALYGFSVEELIGKSWNLLYEEDVVNTIDKECLPVVMRQGAWRGELVGRRKDGTRFDVEVVLQARTNEAKQFVGLVCYCHDITARVRQEKALQEVYQQLEQRVMDRTSELLHTNEALRQTSAHLQTLIEASPLAIIELDAAGKAVSWNTAAVRMFGWTEHEVLGRDLPYVPAGQKEEEESAQIWESVMQGGSRNVELRRVRKDGSIVDVNFWGAARRNSAGRVIGSIGFLIDMTQQKRLEKQFRQAQKMEAVGRLAGGVAHDFNNLLTVINGCSALLLDQVRREDPMYVLLDETLRAGERAADLTRQLLAFSRQQVLKLQRIDLNESFSVISSMLKRLMGEDIELAVQSQPNLWPIQADKGQVNQVLMNLAVNARDAMPDGGTLTITTDNFVLKPGMPVPHPVFTPGEYVHVRVRDTGYGMDQEVRSHLFEPFFTTKEEGKGTGLGLATVYGIVKQSHGFIFVDSELGKGATFDLYFPRFIEADKLADSAAPSRPKRGAERVLLVEDMDSVRELVSRALEGYGYKVIKAANGEEAIRLVAVMTEPIDVLVTDVVMPRMTGPVVADRLRAHWPGLRVLFMSGYTERVKPVFLNSPGTLFIQKPFLPTELVAQLRRLLDEPG
jgi:PAS domain S-box-containing protein